MIVDISNLSHNHKKVLRLYLKCVEARILKEYIGEAQVN